MASLTRINSYKPTTYSVSNTVHHYYETTIIGGLLIGQPCLGKTHILENIIQGKKLNLGNTIQTYHNHNMGHPIHLFHCAYHFFSRACHDAMGHIHSKSLCIVVSLTSACHPSTKSYIAPARNLACHPSTNIESLCIQPHTLNYIVYDWVSMQVIMDPQLDIVIHIAKNTHRAHYMSIMVQSHALDA